MKPAYRSCVRCNQMTLTTLHAYCPKCQAMIDETEKLVVEWARKK